MPIACGVRAVSDEQTLLMGAQENLQCQNLDPGEGAQIVAWPDVDVF